MPRGQNVIGKNATRTKRFTDKKSQDRTPHPDNESQDRTPPRQKVTGQKTTQTKCHMTKRNQDKTPEDKTPQRQNIRGETRRDMDKMSQDKTSHRQNVTIHPEKRMAHRQNVTGQNSAGSMIQIRLLIYSHFISRNSFFRMKYTIKGWGGRQCTLFSP